MQAWTCSRLFRKFDEGERRMVVLVLSEWTLSNDGGTRFDAQHLIAKFSIAEPAPAPRQSIEKIGSSRSPGAPHEFEKIERILARSTSRITGKRYCEPPAVDAESLVASGRRRQSAVLEPVRTQGSPTAARSASHSGGRSRNSASVGSRSNRCSAPTTCGTSLSAWPSPHKNCHSPPSLDTSNIGREFENT